MRSAIMRPNTMVMTMLVAGVLSSSVIGLGRMVLNADVSGDGQLVFLDDAPEQATVFITVR